MKKAIVIGASSGIGAEIAKLLAENNYKVGITGRRLDLLTALKTTNPSAFLVSNFDCTQVDNVEKLELLTSELGGLDLLVFSSGIGNFNKYLDYAIENETNQLNVIAFTQIMDWAFNYFNNQKSGHIVGITSISGIRGGKASPAYNASKAYQISYLQAIRQRAFSNKFGVTITDIRPGFVDTEMAKGPGMFWIAPKEKAAKQILRHIKNKSKVAYVTKRWRIIAVLLKILPNWIYNRM